ncbi:hypothetical protein TPENAI_30197 [Tenacibaculum litopenaei]|jgi:nitrogen regulatory protein PII-like uncharacterized protein|uniref:hypothetical protein n=1 Tax=Tenacibaculum litopenaei TaxID=396016 RepID=UPI003893F86E
MAYTSSYLLYFSTVLKTKGVPVLNADQWRRFQNISAIEYHIKRIHDMGLKHSLFSELQKEEAKLKKLVKGLPPEALFEEMLTLSQA